MRRGLQSAVDLIQLGVDAGEPWEFGVDQFDSLLPDQQLALLAEIGRALFYRSVRAPIHTAINEAGVYVIFRALLNSIELEIDGIQCHDTPSRHLVCDFLAAYVSDEEFAEFDEENEGGRLTPESVKIDDWEFEIECIADRILWDRDFELGDLMIDCVPEKAEFLKSYLAIDDEYFTSISPDPRYLVQVRRTLRRLLHEKPR